jgi:hypothetical protein
VVGAFSGLTRKAILKQAKTELPSDTVQLCHTGVTALVGFTVVIGNDSAVIDDGSIAASRTPL